MALLTARRYSMPTTPIKNLLYRLLLPTAPGPDKNCIMGIQGHGISQPGALTRILRKNHVLGSSILISNGKDYSVILSGSENPKHIPAMDTYYRVASITKSATSLLAAVLTEKGLLDLDIPVRHYLDIRGSIPQLSAITLRHLLSHTSGIQDPPGLENMLVKRLSLEQIIRSVSFSPPGKYFCYSNLGFGMIGAVAESVCGESIQDIFTRYLFDPLNLNATLYAGTISGMIMPITRIIPYRKGTDITVTELGKIPMEGPAPEFHLGYTAGSMYIDLLSLFKMFLCLKNQGKPLLKNGTAEMIRPHAAYGKSDPHLSYGLGLLLIQDTSGCPNRIIGHQGFAYGCVDGAFWEENTDKILISLNGGSSEARKGRLGILNRDLIRWAFYEELTAW